MKRMGSVAAPLGLAWMLAVHAVLAADSETRFDRQAAIDRLAPSLVRVEYTLQYDKSDAPRGAGVSQRCPTCGRYHVGDELATYLREERPLEAPGFLIAPTRVVTTDVMIHPRFIRSIAVRQGEKVVSARVSAFALQQSAVLLDLAGPLSGAVPLEFVASPEPPFEVATYNRAGSDWMLTIQPMSERVTRNLSLAERRFRTVVRNSILLDAQGRPAGLAMNEDLPLDDTWVGSPAAWPALSAEQYEQLRARIEKRAAAGVLRATLRFRSPRAESGMSRWRRAMRDEDVSDTERHVIAVVTGPRQVLILSELDAKVTARLEKIELHLADGSTRTANFAYSLRERGALVADLDEPLPEPLVFTARDIRDFERVLVPAAEVELFGTTRVQNVAHVRIASFEPGRKNLPYPEVAGDTDDLFMFDQDGGLVALPMTYRRKAGEDRGWRDEEKVLTPAAYVRALLADATQTADPTIVPLTEEQENRIAWLGVELQALNADLARANNVSDQSRGGSIGAIISFVYPDSPAAKAGLEAGDIILRLHVPDRPDPIEVQVTEDFGGGMAFPWDRLDTLPEEYFDMIPCPWPSVENTFNRTLTEIGFGRTYRAELIRDGAALEREFEVVESPPHYDSAPKFKSEPLGLTVRDITFELAHYFRRESGEPGVIVAKIEPGSRASVAGLKPHEIITKINDQPVHNAREFEAAVTGATGELRLAVQRMTRSRIAKIDLSTPPPARVQPPTDGDEGDGYTPEVDAD